MASSNDFPKTIKELPSEEIPINFLLTFLAAVSNYRPPTDSTMGPANYPPAVNIESTSQRPTFEGYNRQNQPRFKAKDFSEAWNLSSAFQQ
ncbi:hypothetical protein C4D60_Mb10t28450 [Musa balbisiana]|uniref:Uncharacterized protein n=1 Tax=Musa balbisiana TaxID=52838 RepID=A0A4S8J2X2_MUSBA|nr:hypothetical protein C4D60_Mb10t28450 [Musa balbisiana]